ncbi:hypothetical protein SRHO_G00108350 [Serrasalmus rhombeus]
MGDLTAELNLVVHQAWPAIEGTMQEELMLGDFLIAPLPEELASINRSSMTREEDAVLSLSSVMHQQRECGKDWVFVFIHMHRSERAQQIAGEGRGEAWTVLNTSNLSGSLCNSSLSDLSVDELIGHCLRVKQNY